MGDALQAGLQRAQADLAVRAVAPPAPMAPLCRWAKAGRNGGWRDRQKSLEQRPPGCASAPRCRAVARDAQTDDRVVIPGAAAGAGLAMAMACDFRLATARAKMTVAFAKVGLAGDYGASYFLTQIVGAARARELLMLSPVLTAEQALGLGLVHRVWADDEFAAQADAFVASLAEGPTVSLGYIKQNINLAARSDLATSLTGEASAQARCMATDDHAEAAKAFVEKRPPVFRGV
ncbi:MAG: enoyl-CoA hydratase-related protein [Burkholderiaceae bacterium]